MPRAQVLLMVARCAGAHAAIQTWPHEPLDNTFVVDNRSGTNGIIGVDWVAKTVSDGYTLLAGVNGQLVANSA